MPFGSEQWMYASGGFYPYEIDQSLRFNDDDDAYLSRTPATSSNQKTWTWSGWVKRGNLNSDVALFSAHDPTFGSSVNRRITVLRFSSDNTLHLFNRYFPSTTVYDSTVTTNAIFRDPSAWYHVVLAFDTTEVTASDRVKIYVNGVLQSVTASGTGYPEYNIDYGPNCDQIHQIGRWSYIQGYPYDGYMAEVNFIDGQALDATSFGEFKSGVWVPKEYEGTYGTNGFYLDFGNSGSLGADSSGNGNNWTPNNLATTDQVPDSPTNNFATLNPLDVYDSPVLSNGNLDVSVTSSANRFVGSTFRINEGKCYFEYLNRQSTTSTNNTIGLTFGNAKSAQDELYSYAGFILHSTSVTMGSTGSNAFARLGLGSGTTDTNLGWKYGLNDVVNVAVDFDNKKVWFGKNGVWYNSGNPALGTNATLTINSAVESMQPYDAAYHVGSWNFGQDSSFAGNKTAQGNTDANGIGDFYYAPPAGYLALCTANLPDPAIDPAQDDVPADYFNTVLYAGNGSTQSITGVGFQPDFVWVKTRTQTYSHHLADAVRGANNILFSNLSNAESARNTITAFNADGFSVSTDSNNDVSTNASGQTFVAWNWLAGNGTVSNTDGTITSTVSANQKAGFSIVSFNAGTAGTQTVGHGLSSAPEFFVMKDRDISVNWDAYSAFIGNTKKLRLNTNDSEITSTAWNNTSPTSSVVTFVSDNPVGANNNAIMYAFHSVEGFSKFGSYTGNGSTDGPFVYTGFRPAFVMVKRTDAAGYNWLLWDTARDPENTFEQFLYPNLSDAEDTVTNNAADSVSNGFKLRSSGASRNASGGTYIYMAFSEMPFKYSNAR